MSDLPEQSVEEAARMMLCKVLEKLGLKPAFSYPAKIFSEHALKPEATVSVRVP